MLADVVFGDSRRCFAGLLLLLPALVALLDPAASPGDSAELPAPAASPIPKSSLAIPPPPPPSLVVVDMRCLPAFAFVFAQVRSKSKGEV
jgi:hypothetical protein